MPCPILVLISAPDYGSAVLTYEAVILGKWSIWLGLLSLVAWLPVKASEQGKDLDREFKVAIAQYDAGQYADAAVRLERIVRQVPESFEVHELLGLVYSGQSQDAKANPHFEKAVRLKPTSAAARSNLAANLSRLGKNDLAETQFRKAVELEPDNFDANHNLGESHVRAGKVAEGCPVSEQSSENQSLLV